MIPRKGILLVITILWVFQSVAYAYEISKSESTNRPIWLISNMELIRFAPDKMSIGANTYSHYECNKNG